MSWLVLIASGMMEAVWARALGDIRGIRRPLPLLIFLGALAVSLGGLAYAMQTIPTGSAYAVWVGVGASLTVVWGIIVKEEPFNLIRLALIALLIASVVGLMVVS